jgi:hypothetical protein
MAVIWIMPASIRCWTCRRVAVILPAVMAKMVGLDCGLNKLARA